MDKNEQSRLQEGREQIGGVRIAPTYVDPRIVLRRKDYGVKYAGRVTRMQQPH